MRTTFISLGSGCDIASALERMRLRDDSYPFDWLWNFDTGLESVIDIVKSDFVHIEGRDSCELADHYRFPEKKSVVYAQYPLTVHLHSNPMHNENDWRTLTRRINRFRQVMADDETYINFIYYRILEEALIKKPATRMEDEFKRLSKEGEHFFELIKTKYPRKKFKLILVFQTDPLHRQEAEKLVDNANAIEPDARIVYSYTFARNDANEMQDKQRKKQWQEVIRNNAWFPLPMLYYKTIVPALWAIRRLVKKKQPK